MKPSALKDSLAAGLTPELLRRHDMAGPRYTSYPTAPEWTGAVDGATLERHLAAMRERAENGAAPRSLSLYVHLPFCQSRCAFCACNAIATPRGAAVSEPYLDCLEREADLYARALAPGRPVVQMHWGGGTPTYLEPRQLRRLHAILTRRFALEPGAEQSIEIHSDATSDEKLETLAELGLTRISIGVQDFDPEVQAAIGRNQDMERTARLVALARRLGFGGVNFDLVYGLPLQSAERFAATIARAVELRPDRLALYNFAYLPSRMANQRAIDPATLPPPEEKLRIFLMARERLEAAGYRAIGLDHFALPGDALTLAYDAGTMRRNFMGLAPRGGDATAALGATAIGDHDGLYVQNAKRLSRYEKAVDAGQFPVERGLLLSRDDLIRRDVIEAIMCRDRVDARAVEIKYNIRFNDYFSDALARLAPMAEDGLVELDGGGDGDGDGDVIRLTPLGRLLARNVAMIFDAYLKRPGGKKGFSRTV